MNNGSATSCKRQSGFTLIELMVTVVIVAILAAVAVPMYADYVRRGKIPDAISNLASKRVQMEQYFQDNHSYSGSPVCDDDTATSQYFDFSCTADPTDTTYTLQAVGKNSMAGFTYTIDQDNNKATTITGVSGWTGNTSCWVTNKGGTC